VAPWETFVEAGEAGRRGRLRPSIGRGGQRTKSKDNIVNGCSWNCVSVEGEKARLSRSRAFEQTIRGGGKKREVRFNSREKTSI